jgi:hypothetical protein
MKKRKEKMLPQTQPVFNRALLKPSRDLKIISFDLPASGTVQRSFPDASTDYVTKP